LQVAESSDSKPTDSSSDSNSQSEVMPLPEPAASSEMRKEETSSNEENNANLINVVSGCCKFLFKKSSGPFWSHEVVHISDFCW
jgi:targeting protein for Xklp2